MPPGGRLRRAAHGTAIAGLVALPGCLTVVLAFQSGGYFVTAPAVLAALLLLIAGLRFATTPNGLASVSLPGLAALVFLALYGGWTLMSAGWSGSDARALLEFDRVLLYFGVLVLVLSVPSTAGRLRWMVRALALGLFLVCLCGLITRLLPDLWPITEAPLHPGRLSFPLGYWNAVGVLCALGLVLGVHLTSSQREPIPIRALGAAACPVLAATLLFTFSRGAIAMAAIGLLAYSILARPRYLVTGLLATAPATVIAVRSAYAADLLAREDHTTPGAVAQGHDVAAVIALAVIGALLLRVLLVPVDGLLARARLRARLRYLLWTGGLAALVVGALVAAVAFDARQVAAEQYERFVEGATPEAEDSQRDRLADASSNGRLQFWKVAAEAFEEHELRGTGAGTFQILWARDRPRALAAVDAHSLYLEVLAELGVVGLALLGLTFIALLGGVIWRMRGVDRAAYAAVVACMLAWMVHAGFDWDWEMSAITLWLFALAGFACARRPLNSARQGVPIRLVGLGVAITLISVAVIPAQLALSQIRLDRGVRAFLRNDCRGAKTGTVGSIAALPTRPEPYEVLGYCAVRLGAPRAGVGLLNRAVSLDPDNWEFRYGLALVRASAGLDPGPAIRVARRLNPLDERAREFSRNARAGDATTDERWARAAPLPVVRGGPAAETEAPPTLGRAPRSRDDEARRPRRASPNR